MKDYQRVLSKRILEELDPEKTPLLETILKMEKELKVSSSAKEKGMPLIDPGMVSMFAKPLIISIVAGIIGKVILDATKRKLERYSKHELAKIVTANKKGIVKESLQISLKSGVDKRTISKIQKEIFNLVDRRPQILSIEYKRKK